MKEKKNFCFHLFDRANIKLLKKLTSNEFDLTLNWFEIDFPWNWNWNLREQVFRNLYDLILIRISVGIISIFIKLVWKCFDFPHEHNKTKKIHLIMKIILNTFQKHCDFYQKYFSAIQTKEMNKTIVLYLSVLYTFNSYFSHFPFINKKKSEDVYSILNTYSIVEMPFIFIWLNNYVMAS